MTRARVLVVEDDVDIRESLVESLVDFGYEARGAVNGRDALDQLARGDQPCLIFLDLMMPLMDGRQFREEQLRSATLAAIPVVVISAYRDVAENARDMGAAAYLRKPIRIQDVLGLTRQYCA